MDDDKSLKYTFSQAVTSQAEQDEIDPRTSVFKEKLRSTVQSFEQCRSLVLELSMFSPNEEADDISTQDLQYLTVDYRIAELLLKSYDDARLAALRRSSQLLESFLDRLDQYGLLVAADRKLFERFKESRSSFSLISTANVEERRRLKISRFQEEKALKQKMEVSSPV